MRVLVLGCTAPWQLEEAQEPGPTYCGVCALDAAARQITMPASSRAERECEMNRAARVLCIREAIA
jgi:hypothetical protein